MRGVDLQRSPPCSVALLDHEIEASIGFVRFEARSVSAFKISYCDAPETLDDVQPCDGWMADEPQIPSPGDHHHFDVRPDGTPAREQHCHVDRRHCLPHSLLIGDRDRIFPLYDCAPSLIVSISAHACY